MHISISSMILSMVQWWGVESSLSPQHHLTLLETLETSALLRVTCGPWHHGVTGGATSSHDYFSIIGLWIYIDIICFVLTVLWTYSAS